MSNDFFVNLLDMATVWKPSESSEGLYQGRDRKTGQPRWTATTRRQHSRAGLRYETDLTDTEWAVIGPLMPEAASCGRPPIWTMREILNAIFYVLRGGIAWRLIPTDLPPRSTTYGYFSRWRDDGLFGRINHHLVMVDRERVGREASPTGAILDSHPSRASG